MLHMLLGYGWIRKRKTLWNYGRFFQARIKYPGGYFVRIRISAFDSLNFISERCLPVRLDIFNVNSLSIHHHRGINCMKKGRTNNNV
jgi:hypothetical protein